MKPQIRQQIIPYVKTRKQGSVDLATASDEKKKKVSFNIEPIDKDTSGDTLVIDKGTPGTDGQNNGNISTINDFSIDNDGDITDDDEVPCSQMVHTDPYIKTSSSEAEDNYSQDGGLKW